MKSFLKVSLLAAVVYFGFCSVSFAANPKPQANQPETVLQNVPKEVASDTNQDGKPDRWEKYQDGVLVSIQADSNFDGTVDEKGYLENGKLVKVEKDSDGDGKMDKWVSY